MFIYVFLIFPSFLIIKKKSEFTFDRSSYLKHVFLNEKMQCDEMIFAPFYHSVHISAHEKVYAGITLTNNETQYCLIIRVLHGFLVAVVPFMLHVDI